MAEKGFGVKEINLIGASGTPTIESPNNLNLNAVNVAISTNATIGGNLTVSGTVGIAGTLTYEDVTNIDSVGVVTAREGIIIPDNKVLSLGSRLVGSTAGDLRLYHDTNNSYIDEIGSGNLYIRNGSNNSIYCQTSGKVELYYNGNDKLATTNTGVTVTGTVTANAFSGDGSNLTGVSGTPADTDPQVVFDVSASGSSGYIFTGPGNDGSTVNPNIYLMRGQRYRFINTTGSSHPFEFRNADNSADFTDGITGSQSGTQDFNVQYDAPAHLKYRCTIHGSMIGNIYIRSGADTGASAGTENIEIGGFLRFDNTISKILTDTSDGSDDKAIFITGGGDTATSRGALAILYGNELNSGRLDLYSGVGGGAITFNTGTTTTERLRITSTGTVLKGITTARQNYSNNTSGVEYGFQIEDTSATKSSLSLIRSSNDANDGGIFIGKTRSTSVGGNTVVQAGDDLGTITFGGADGTSLLFGAEIIAEAQSGVGNDDMPTDLIFKTNGGSTNTAERLRIASDGKISQGGHTPSYEYDLRGTGLQSILIGSENAAGAMLILDGDSNGDGAGSDYASILHSSAGNIEINNRKNGSIIFKNTSNETERLRITSDGNINIPFADNGTGLRQKIRFVTESNFFDEVAYISANRTAVSNAPTDLVFGTGALSGGSVNTQERLRITSTGQVKISGVDDQDNLVVNGGSTQFAVHQDDSDGEVSLRAQDGSGSNNSKYMTFFTNPSGSAAAERLRITHLGKINIGNTDLNQTTDQFCVSISAQNAVDNVIRFQSAAAASGTSESLVKIYKGAGYGGVISGYITQGSDHGLKFYTADNGTLSERLRISKPGYITKPSNPAFHARPPGNYSISGGSAIIGGTWSTSDSESFVRGTLANGNSIWNNSTGIFTVPVTGIYFIHWSVFLASNTTRRDAYIYRGNDIIARTEIGDPEGTTGNNKSVSVSTVVSLSVNDEIKFAALTTGGSTIYQTAKPWSYACAYLVG